MKKLLALVLIGVLLMSTAAFAAPAPKTHDISAKVDISFADLGDSTEVTVMLPKIGSTLESLVITKIKPKDPDKTIDFFVDAFDFETGTWDSTMTSAKDPDFYWGTIDYDVEAEMYTIVFHFDGNNVSDIQVEASFSAGKSPVTFACDKTAPVE